MSNTKHTPGPWISISDSVLTKEDDPQVVAYMSNHRNRQSRDWRETEANAHLVAAAPDLLTACKEARQWLGDAPPDGEGEFYDELRRVLSIMDAAIAKGEA